MRLFRFGDRESATSGYYWGTGTVIERFQPPIGTLCMSGRFSNKGVEIATFSEPGKPSPHDMRSVVLFLLRHSVDELSIQVGNWSVLEAGYEVFYNLVMAYTYWGHFASGPVPIDKFERMSVRGFFAFPRGTVEPSAPLSPFPPGSTWQDYLAQSRFSPTATGP